MTERKRRRTTQQVKDDIIKAVGNALTKHGINKLGVETVAAEAGMDKAMLYRHFKDFNDILKHYIEHEDYWINSLEKELPISARKDLAPYVSIMLKNQFYELLRNKKLQELMIWELVDKNQLMKDSSQKREDMAINILDNVKEFYPHKDVSSNNILALITAGINYLALHKDISTFCNIDLNNKEHQKKFADDLSWLIEHTFSPESKVERIALNCLKKGMNLQQIADITELSVEHIETLKSK